MPHLPAHLRKRLLLLLLVLIMAAPLLLGGWQIITPFSSIPLHLLAAFILLVICRWYFLGLRCHLVFAAHNTQPSLHRLITINMACDFLGEWTPASSGKPLAWFSFLKEERVSTTVAAAAGLVNTAFDWVGMLLVLLLASAWLLLSQASTALAVTALTLLGGIALLSVLLIYGLYNRRLLTWLDRLPLEKITPTAWRTDVEKLRHQLPLALENSLRLPPIRQITILLISTAYWLTRLSFLFLALHMAGQFSHWPSAALTQFLGAIAGWVSLLPTGFPATDLTLGALLGQQMPLANLLSVILLWRLMTLYTNLAIGGIAFLWLSAKAK